MPISEQLVADLYASPSKPGAVLVTITAAGIDPVRACSWPGGLTSGGDPYPYAPFGISWSGASREAQSRQAKLTIGFSAEVLEMVRLAQGRPQATVERVRIAAPNVVERAINGAFVTDAQINRDSVSVTLGHRNYGAEYACHARYLKARTPALY